eukprot:CAMPEP_0173394584 /NCGR_PEP_ID=MMETSP1356-20130122/28290_1 /TAXON_ID=77927 ORGANISM="Hemiselmis virescens, Strain PCC157" /NCGR_SAMPLE_ID=MMETSP1356 /ASSEMBLY_ACC=CAM_ASM_000847 /LENGTH=90 /DNA_ID=CAMNT_0014353003 /DNA_START=42 /DNA_END=310 /DNA_ORIENTATION=-
MGHGIPVQVPPVGRPNQVPVGARPREAVDVLPRRPVVAVPRVVAVGHLGKLEVTGVKGQLAGALGNLQPLLVGRLAAPRRRRRLEHLPEG